jgi:hypothetical protein
MIKHLFTNSQHIYLTTSGGTYIIPGTNGAGVVRFNPLTSRMEVNDGTLWIEAGTEVQIHLSSEAVNAIDWVKKKMAEEEELKRIAATNQALRSALDNVEQARRELDLIFNLTKTY